MKTKIQILDKPLMVTAFVSAIVVLISCAAFCIEVCLDFPSTWNETIITVSLFVGTVTGATSSLLDLLIKQERLIALLNIEESQE